MLFQLKWFKVLVDQLIRPFVGSLRFSFVVFSSFTCDPMETKRMGKHPRLTTINHVGREETIYF